MNREARNEFVEEELSGNAASKPISLGWLVLWVIFVMAVLFVAVGMDGATNGPLFVSKEFSGLVQEINGNVITMRGNYVVEGHPETMEAGAIVVVDVFLRSDTEIIKQRIFDLSPEELQASGGRYVVANLRKEEVSGSYEELAESAALVVYTSDNIFGRKTFKVDRVMYVVSIGNVPGFVR